MVALSIVNLSKRIGNDYLFRNLDIEVHEGEILCLSAPSGYGKTTLLKVRTSSGPFHLQTSSSSTSACTQRMPYTA